MMDPPSSPMPPSVSCAFSLTMKKLKRHAAPHHGHILTIWCLVHLPCENVLYQNARMSVTCVKQRPCTVLVKQHVLRSTCWKSGSLPREAMKNKCAITVKCLVNDHIVLMGRNFPIWRNCCECTCTLGRSACTFGCNCAAWRSWQPGA